MLGDAASLRSSHSFRQHFPKGTDFATVTEAQLEAVADELNDQPRKRLATEEIGELRLQ